MPNPTDTTQTTLRDRIAQAIEDAPYRPEDRRSLQLADAVLAVLPEPADRAAVLREAIDIAREEGHRLEEVVGFETARGARCVAYLLRKRLAKERTAAERPAVAYSDGKGNARVYCLACPRPADVAMPLTADAVEDWDLCPSCGRHVVDVARAAASTKEARRD